MMVMKGEYTVMRSNTPISQKPNSTLARDSIDTEIKLVRAHGPAPKQQKRMYLRNRFAAPRAGLPRGRS